MGQVVKNKSKNQAGRHFHQGILEGDPALAFGTFALLHQEAQDGDQFPPAKFSAAGHAS